MKAYLWSTALLMIFLVITIPIISSNVLASLSVTTTGEDKVDGFLKTYDSVNILAHSSKTGLNASDVKLNNENTFTSCAAGVTGGTDCKYFVDSDSMRPGANEYTVTAGDENFTGYVYIDGINPRVTVSAAGFSQSKGNITVSYQVTHDPVDSSSISETPGRSCPGIKRIEFIADDGVIATKQVNQTPYNCNYIPNGVQTFHVPGTGNKKICIIAYDNLEHAGYICQNMFIDNDAPTVQDVKILRSPNMCKEFYDFSNVGGNPVCKSTTDPKLNYTPEGTEIDYISTQAEDAYVQAFINDTGNLSLSTVRADLSELVDIQQYKDQLKDMPYAAPPLSNPDMKIFTWKVKMNVFSGGAKNLVFKASDSAGNVMEKTVPVTLNLDTAKPEITSITTDKCRERCAGTECTNVCYVGPGWNKLYVKVNEVGSGLDFNNIFLDLGAFNSDYQGKQMRVAKCDQGLCEGWFQVGKGNIDAIQNELKSIAPSSLTPEEEAAAKAVISGGISNVLGIGAYALIALMLRSSYTIATATGVALPVSVIAPSQDDAGNAATGDTQGAFVLDKDAPKVEGVSVMSITDLGPVKHHKSGDLIYVVANVSDFTPVTAVADFSRVTGGGTAEEGSCSYDDKRGVAVCEWQVGPILNGPMTTFMTLNFTDFVGNTLSHKETVEILETGNESYNIWTIPGGRIINSVAPVSRATAQVMPDPGYPVYFSVPLETMYTGDDGARILGVRATNCVFGKYKNNIVEDEPEIMNNYEYGYNLAPGSDRSITPGNVYPVTLLFHLTSQPLPDESMQLKCVLQITSKLRGTLPPPQKLNLTLQIDLFNANLGEPDKALEDEMKRTEWQIFGWGQALGTIKMVFGFVKAMCNTLNMVINILNVVANLLWVLSEISETVGDAAAGWPVVGQVIKANMEITSVSTCTGGNTVTKGVKGIYQMVSYACDFVSCRRTLAGFIPGYNKVITKMTQVWSLNFKSLSQKTGAAESADWEKATSNAAVQNTLIWSVLTLCIPGIIENWEKGRSISCEYYKCLQTVPDGTPMQVCKAAKGQEICQFWVGEAFALIPFVNLMDSISSAAKSVFAQKLNLIGLTLGLTCVLPCYISSLVGKITSHLCAGYELYLMIGELIKDIKGITSITDMYSNSMYDSCRGIKKGFPQRGEGTEDLTNST